jgi:DNA modification methylase
MRSIILNALLDEFLAKIAKKAFKFTEFDDGIVINGSCTDPEVVAFVKKYLKGKKIQLTHTDPPYGNIVSNDWDQTKLDQYEFANWMKEWVKQWLPLMHEGSALYIWGGTGIPNFRPFFVFCSEIESDPDIKLTIANIITWSKRRAFGVKKNYLYTREECVYLVNAPDNNPRVFNIPLTDKLRGYEGFSAKYKAKSPYLRRTNIWSITELFQGKIHPTEKPTALIRIPIEASSNKNEYVLDLFGGSGSTAVAARECGRKFIIIEKDVTYYKNIVKRLKS